MTKYTAHNTHHTCASHIQTFKIYIRISYPFFCINLSKQIILCISNTLYYYQKVDEINIISCTYLDLVCRAKTGSACAWLYFFILYFCSSTLYVLHVISANKRNIISTTYNILHFSRMLPKITCWDLRRWEKTSLHHHKWKFTSMVFESLKYHVFLYVITRETFLV
jgi:hypothetical protein